MNNIKRPMEEKARLSTKVKKQVFLDSLQKYLGVQALAMKDADIKSRQTIINWKTKDKKFAKSYEEIEAHTGDFVESKLLNKIKEGDTTAIIFYCKTKLKNRGYIERNELTGKDGANFLEGIKIDICDSKPQDNEDI